MYINRIIRYGGELPQTVRDIICGHFRDYNRRARLITGAGRKGSQMLQLQRYNRSVDRAIDQAISAHGICGTAAQSVREDLLAVASCGKAQCANGYGAMYSPKQYVAIREDALFFAARELGLV